MACASLRLGPKIDNLGSSHCQPFLSSDWPNQQKGKKPDEHLVFVSREAAVSLEHDLERAGLKKWGPGGKVDFHALRVAYTTFVLDSGANAKEAQPLARHSTPSLTMNTYARARQDRLAEVAESVGNTILPQKCAISVSKLAVGMNISSSPKTSSTGILMVGREGFEPP